MSSYDTNEDQRVGQSVGATGTNDQSGDFASGQSGQPGDQQNVLGNISHVASNVVRQGAEKVVTAGKGVIEMGGNVISGLKRGFSKSSESGE